MSEPIQTAERGPMAVNVAVMTDAENGTGRCYGASETGGLVVSMPGMSGLAILFRSAMWNAGAGGYTIRYAYEDLASEQFTKADVEYLVAESKYIKCIPNPRPLHPHSGNGIRIQIEVFRKSEPKNPVAGLIVMATARSSPSGVPKPNPSAALEWNGRRIRGLNYEVWHDNPDGTIVKGWHEHIWSPARQDSYVVPARPEPTRKTLIEVFRWGLEKWRIEVLEEQLELS